MPESPQHPFSNQGILQSALRHNWQGERSLKDRCLQTNLPTHHRTMVGQDSFWKYCGKRACKNLLRLIECPPKHEANELRDKQNFPTGWFPIWRWCSPTFQSTLRQEKNKNIGILSRVNRYSRFKRYVFIPCFSQREVSASQHVFEFGEC